MPATSFGVVLFLAFFLGEFLERGFFARTTLDRVLREGCRRGKAFSVNTVLSSSLR
jgi:hypothetical protein